MMSPYKFNHAKTIKRNPFTVVFGRVGKRKMIHVQKRPSLVLRFRIQMTRRAHQGWRNRVYGSRIALQMRHEYGRHKTISPFRR